MILADTGDVVSFGGLLIFTVAVPGIGLLISAVSMQKQGLNKLCGYSTSVFFVALLIECVAWSLSNRAGITAKAELIIIAGTALLHCISAILAIVGIAEVRTRRKWPRGRKRGVWTFWLNIAMLLVLSLWFYAHVSQKFYDRIFK